MVRRERDKTDMSPREKLLAIRQWLLSLFVEREEVVNGLLVSLISKNHVLLVGAPGTAKSMMARALCSAIQGGKYFERLLTKFSTPDEIFGAVKLSALKEDKFERNISGHLPTSNIAFIDEIFKANSSILNALLTIINERIFHNNGQPVTCPLITMIGASNELPEDETLTALFDRFLLRYVVSYVKEDSAFREMLTKEYNMTPPVTITIDELNTINSELQQIQIPDKLIDLLIEVRKALNKEGIIVSDRRYLQCITLLKAKAYLEGRSVITEDDIEILQHAFWSEPSQIQKVTKTILTLCNPYGRQADEIYDALISAWNDVLKEKDGNTQTTLATELLAKIKKASNELKAIREAMSKEGRDTSKVDKYISELQDIAQKKIMGDILGIN